MNVLRSAAAWLDRVRHAKLSEAVTYQRSGASAFSANATIGRTGSDQLVEGELVAGVKLRDWIFRVADLKVSGTFVPPRRGDTVTDAAGKVWDVVEPPGGEEVWRWSTEYEDSARVHTRLR